MRLLLRGWVLAGGVAVVLGLQGCASGTSTRARAAPEPSTDASKPVVAAAPRTDEAVDSTASKTSPVSTVSTASQMGLPDKASSHPVSMLDPQPESLSSQAAATQLPAPKPTPKKPPRSNVDKPQQTPSADKPQQESKPDKPNKASDDSETAPKAPSPSPPAAQPAAARIPEANPNPVKRLEPQSVRDVTPKPQASHAEPSKSDEATKAAPVLAAAPEFAPLPTPENVAPSAPSAVNALASVDDTVVTLEALPLTIADEWVLSATSDACNLMMLPVLFDDGQGTSKLQLVFNVDRWLIKTQSDIDLSYDGTGLWVDETTYFSLEQVARDSDLVFTKQYAAMTQRFLAGVELKVVLGFWPSWPVTETKTISVSLRNFRVAHDAWKKCQSLIKNH